MKKRAQLLFFSGSLVNRKCQNGGLSPQFRLTGPVGDGGRVEGGRAEKLRLLGLKGKVGLEQ